MKNISLALILGVIFFSHLYSQEQIHFLSANPFSFRDIIKNLDNQESQEVSGILRLPDDGLENQKFPLIIGRVSIF